MANRTNLIDEIGITIDNLSKVRDALKDSDPDMLYKLLEEGSRRKEESLNEQNNNS